MFPLLAPLVALNLASCEVMPSWCPRCVLTEYVISKLEQVEKEKELDQLFAKAQEEARKSYIVGVYKSDIRV